MAVNRLGYVHARVTDLEEAIGHYSNTLGQRIVEQQDGRVYLKSWDEFDHHSVVLEEGGVGLVKLGFKVQTDDDLAGYEKRITQFGATTERMSKGENLAVGDGLRVVLPSEHVVEFYTEMEYLGTETGTWNPDPWPRDTRGAGVHRLDHALIAAEDPALVERFFMECLDFRPAERLISDPTEPDLVGSWLFCGQKAHDLAVIKGENGKLHHWAYWLDDWNDVLRAGDIFSMDEVSIDIGPTRHGITRGKTIYFFDPSGNRNEVFTGGYITGADFPTITWTTDQIGKAIFYVTRELNDRFTSVFT
ncbi:catechol 2,3-dioxygenase [[Mycobacterium] crassicus]|uniref:Metapyrocatechase n=1 Tax=[Mycobacterium] crassicus TaxID=2872309 RepID=A0ABU5XIL3_9MYCO|nr:catechol 2,3-dioxygenase [Mycolicibacter sp. MYC098]MEB3022120.1 catechol 2,3-dioxygenase [Mycolicibacter sp. MYC098]